MQCFPLFILEQGGVGSICPYQHPSSAGHQGKDRWLSSDAAADLFRPASLGEPDAEGGSTIGWRVVTQIKVPLPAEQTKDILIYCVIIVSVFSLLYLPGRGLVETLKMRTSYTRLCLVAVVFCMLHIGDCVPVPVLPPLHPD